MITKKNDTLIDFKGKPNRLVFFSFLVYTVLALAVIGVLAFNAKPYSEIEFYFYIDFATSIAIAWFLSKSLRTQPYERYVGFFRCGLFIIFNCLLVILISGLDFLASQLALVIVSVLFIPAILLIIVSFNEFVSFVNFNYKSAVSLSLTDELTGLPNRRALNFTLRDMEKQAGTVCILDIDHFKRINDSHGHETGDKVLIAIGLALSEFANESVSVSRSGGEEFCIIMKDSINAKELVTKIKKAITMDYNKDIRITISAGVSTKSRYENFTSAMIYADEALCRAKREGRNCIVYADDGSVER